MCVEQFIQRRERGNRGEGVVVVEKVVIVIVVVIVVVVIVVVVAVVGSSMTTQGRVLLPQVHLQMGEEVHVFAALIGVGRFLVQHTHTFSTNPHTPTQTTQHSLPHSRHSTAQHTAAHRS